MLRSYHTGFVVSRVIFRYLLEIVKEPFVFIVQDGLRKGNGIPAANQDIQVEGCFSGREDYQNGEECGNETLREISLSEIYAKSLS